MTAQEPAPASADALLQYRLSLRMGAVHARQRLGIEREFESHLFARGKSWCHIENWYSIHGLIRNILRFTGMLRRGQSNSRRLRTAENRIILPGLPDAFEGFRILHLTDLHVDMDPHALQALIDQIAPMDYDLCVLTGDYRKRTWGPIDDAMEGMSRLRAVIRGTPVAILGNHDSITMVPALEDMGYRLLLNENFYLERGDQRLYIAGVDDAHFFKVHNVQRAADNIPDGATVILLSHTPEIWREAAHAGFDLFLCGQTHGGQICLPGGIPVILDARCPRALGRGRWQHAQMQGYTSPGAGTSVVNARFNCPPEVTLHTLTQGPYQCG